MVYHRKNGNFPYLVTGWRCRQEIAITFVTIDSRPLSSASFPTSTGSPWPGKPNRRR